MPRVSKKLVTNPMPVSPAEGTAAPFPVARPTARARTQTTRYTRATTPSAMNSRSFGLFMSPSGGLGLGGRHFSGMRLGGVHADHDGGDVVQPSAPVGIR